MAITRQKTQVFNQPIGVVRADDGGEKIGQAISANASRMSDLLYREAALEAEAEGQRKAGAQSSQDIITIDPTTGRPVAHRPPASFGRIAARSYQDLIDRRFEDSIADELKERGAAIASDSTSAANYRDRMSAYVQEMYVNAVDDSGELNNYGRFIEETGTAYVASTYETLRQKEIEAAREALIRTSQVNMLEATEDLERRVSLGEEGEQFGLDFASVAALNQSLFDSGDISFSTYASNRERFNGIRAQQGNGFLLSIAANLGADHEDFPRILQAVRDPSTAASLESEYAGITSAISQALLSTSASSIISSLEGHAAQSDTIQENATDQYTRAFSVTSATTVEAIYSYLAGVEPEIRPEVRSNLIGEFIAVRFDAEADTSIEINRIVSELENEAETSFAFVAEIAGNDVARLVRNMSSDDRQGLAQHLTARLDTVGKLEQSEREFFQAQLGSRAAADMRENTFIDNYQSYVDEINNSTLLEDTKRSLLNLYEDHLIDEQIEFANSISIPSVDRAKYVQGLVLDQSQVSPEALEALSDEEFLVFSAYSDAYNLKPTVAAREMTARISGAETQALNRTNNIVLNTVFSAMEEGLPVSDEHLLLAQQSILGPEIDPSIFTASMVLNNSEIMNYANKGYVFPVVVSALNRAMLPNNQSENDASSALQIFDSLTRATASVEGGRTQSLDLLRSRMDAPRYSLLSAVNAVARIEGRPALDILIEARNFEGNVDALIVEELGYPEGTSLNTILDAYGVSGQYREEIKSMMRITRTRGVPFQNNESYVFGLYDTGSGTIDQIIETYRQALGGTQEDDRIFSSLLGDETAFSLNAWSNPQDVLNFERNLVEMVASDPELSRMLTGGTFLDQVGATAANFLNLFVGGAVGAVPNYTYGEEFGVSLRYKPRVETFGVGLTPTWEVGYVLNGAFTPLVMNGETVLYNADVFTQESSTNSERLSRYNQMNRVLNSDASPEEKRRAMFLYDVTLPHTSPESLLEEYPEFAEEIRNLGGSE